MFRSKKKYLALVTLVFLYSCIVVPIKEEKRIDSSTYIEEENYSPEIQTDVFIIYSAGEFNREKVYKTGEIIRHDYHITYDGQIIDFTKYYNLGSKLTNINSIDENTLHNLDSLFKKYDFMNFPPLIAGTNERKGYTDRYIIFGYRPSPRAKFKFVKALTNQVDRKYYPKGFLQLVSALKEAIH